jgi:hypothetical protein
MDILITLNSGLGADVGPNFNLTVNDGGTITPNTATRTELLAGKLVTVSAGSTNIFVTSTGVCTTQLLIPISGITSTTTTTTTAAPTTTTTSTSTSTTSTSTSTTSTTLAPIPVTLAYSNVDGPTACYKFTAPIPITSTYYLQPGGTLADGNTLYVDAVFSNIVADGFYSNGVNYWEVNVVASGGVLSNGTPCPQTTTTTTSTTSTSTTTTTTAAPTTTTTTSGGGGTTTTTTGGPTTYTYLGRSSPNSGNSLDACTAYTTTRGYISLKSNLSLITIGDIIYDSYPSTPTNGGDNWIALKSGGVGDAYSFRINSSGAVTLVGGNCTGATTSTTTTTAASTTTTTTESEAAAPSVDTCSGQTNLAIYNNANAVSLGYTDPTDGSNSLAVCTIGDNPLGRADSVSFIGVFAPSYSTQLSGANGKKLRTWKNSTLFSTINITSSPITVSGDAAFGIGDLVILEVVN